MTVAKQPRYVAPFEPRTYNTGGYVDGIAPDERPTPLPEQVDVPLAAFDPNSSRNNPQPLIAYPSGTVTSAIMEGYGAFDSPLEAAVKQGYSPADVRIAYDIERRRKLQTPAWYRMQYDRARAIAEGRMTEDGQYVDDMLSASERAMYAEDNRQRTQQDVIADIIGYEFTRGAYRDVGARLGAGVLGPYVDTESRLSWMSNTYPGVAEAVVKAGADPNDVAQVSNILVAKGAAEDVINAANQGNEYRARQIMTSLPAGIAALTAGMVEEQYRASQAAAKQAADQGESPVTVAGRFVWNAVPGPAINALMAVNEGALHAVRTVMMATELAAQEALYDGNPLEVAGKMATSGLGTYLPQAWRQTEKGYLNPYTIRDLASEYGDTETAIMIEAYRANQAEDSDSAWEDLWRKYGDDPNAMRILTAGMNTEEFVGGDRSLSDLYVRIAASDQGNLGNLVATGMQLDPTWGITMGIRDVTNVGSTFLFDPTIIGGKALKAYKAAKYGIYLMSDTANVERAFSKPGVKNWFNWYGSEIKTITETADSAERGRRMTTFLSQSKRYADADMADVFIKHKIYTADEARDFFMGMDAVERIINGKPAKIRAVVENDVQAAQAKLTNAGTARRYATDIQRAQESIIRSQSAKRYGEVYTPHMTSAAIKLKQVSSAVRRGADVTKYVSRSTPTLDNLLGPDFTTLNVTQQNERLTNLFLDNAKVDQLASELSDFTGARTLVGNIIGRRTRTPEWDATLQNAGVKRFFDDYRMGWRRKGWIAGTDTLPQSLARKADRWSRLLARFPDTRNGLKTVDATDADKVYQMMRLAGVPRTAASEFRSMWITMDEGQRQLAYIGMVRTYARASGIHLVDPRGLDNVMETVTGVRSSELHAPDQIVRYGAIMQEIDAEAQAIHKSMLDEAAQIQKATGGPAEPVPSLEEITQGIVLRRRAAGDFVSTMNPSIRNGRSGAVFLGQTSDRVALPNFSALDAITARKSYLNLLLFNNRAGSNVTDWWTLATLYGPRFQLRNGIEDIGLYALTGGTLGSYMTGRPIATIVRESTARLDNRVVAARQAWIKADEELKVARKANANERTILNLEEKVRRSKERYEDYNARYGGLGKKLGIVNTARTRLAAAAVDGEREGDRAWRAVSNFLGPFTTKAERLAAAEKGREGVADLNVLALMRQRLYVINDKEAKGLALKLKRGATLDEMSPAQQQIMRDMDDVLRSPLSLGFRDEAAETTRHLVDSTMPAVDDMADLSLIQGQVYRTARINGSYDSERISSTVKPRQAQAMYVSLTMAMGDGPKSQAALLHLDRYWKAVNAKGGSDVRTMEAVVDDVLAAARDSDMWPVYVERFRLSNQLSERDLMKATLDTITGVFTTPQGKFNRALWDRMRTDNDAVPFRLWDDVDGETVARVSVDDFLTGNLPTSASVLVYNSDEVTVPVVDTFLDRRWSEMGRSLARMTREPIWYANYLDSRKVYRPFEKQWAKVFGEESARKKATELAGERAYMLTMSYVDNPAVRSQMAWGVRNIARFYRATEDFARRMWRMARNEPLAFWKASLAWNAVQDTGFMYEDSYGDSYFMYPMTRAGMELMNDAMNVFGGVMKVPGLPMGMSGKMSWLTPSADPEAWAPTLASPIAAILYRPLLRSLPTLDGVTKAIDKAVFGAIGSESNLDVSAPGYPGEVLKSIPYALPPIFNKLLLGALPSALGADVPGSYAAKAGTQAVLALGAAGYLPTPEMLANPMSKEAQEYKRRVDFTATSISLLNLLFGLMAPSAPQLAQDNMSQMGRESGFEGMNPAFLSILKQTIKDGGTHLDAVIKFVKVDPDAAIFTLSRSQGAEYGYMAPLTDNAEFVRNNQDVWNEYPTGMVYFAPATGEETMSAYRALKAFNASPPKPLEQFAMEAATQAGYVQYQIEQAAYRDALRTAATDEQRKDIEAAWSVARNRLLEDEYKGLGARVDAKARMDTSGYRNIATEIRYAAVALAERGNERAKKALPILDDYAAALQAMPSAQDPDRDEKRSDVKEVWFGIAQAELDANPDDQQYQNLLWTLTRALDESWSLTER